MDEAFAEIQNFRRIVYDVTFDMNQQRYVENVWQFFRRCEE